MTHLEAMHLLIDKTDHAVEAAKIIRALDSGSPKAIHRAELLIRSSIIGNSDLTERDKAALSELISFDDAAEERRSETVRFRCTPSEKAALQSLASRHADGNLSKLILDALNQVYPTL